MNKPLPLVLALALLLPAPLFAAEQAQTMLIPQRLVLEPGQRFANLVVKNSGDAPGAYTIELADMVMEEAGGIVPVPEGSPPVEFSARPFTRISPRSVSLAPGEAQTIRVLVRRPEGLEPGEYRSHVKVRIINPNTAAPSAGDNLGVVVRANIVMVIPVIVRQGETSFTAGLEEPRLNGRELQVYITRTGNRSADGNLRVYQKRNGNLDMVASLDGVPVYRPTARRLTRLSLAGAQLDDSPLIIRYETIAKDGAPSEVIAETTLSPS